MSTEISELKSWLDAGLNFFYPPICYLCKTERATAAEGFVCARCRSKPEGVRFIRAPFCERCGLPYDGSITTKFECDNCREMDLHFSAARSAVIATELILEVIHHYKYNRALWFEPFLAELLIGQAGRILPSEGWDMIVPVPLHPVKKREREFNQAERLADHLGRATGIPVAKNVLRRVEATRTQTKLTRPERAANVHAAFAMCGGRKLNGEKILVLDDVLTTGATTSACARVLRRNGAREVGVWTVARGM